jgi:hypothetical protein
MRHKGRRVIATPVTSPKGGQFVLHAKALVRGPSSASNIQRLAQGSLVVCDAAMPRGGGRADNLSSVSLYTKISNAQAARVALLPVCGRRAIDYYRSLGTFRAFRLY